MKTFIKKSVKIHLSVLLLLFTVNISAAPIPKAPNPDVKSYILIDYDSGMTDKAKPRTRDTFIAKVISDYEKEIKDVDLTDDTPDVEEEEKIEEPKGLMARRT